MEVITLQTYKYINLNKKNIKFQKRSKNGRIIDNKATITDGCLQKWNQRWTLPRAVQVPRLLVHFKVPIHGSRSQIHRPQSPCPDLPLIDFVSCVFLALYLQPQFDSKCQP